VRYPGGVPPAATLSTRDAILARAVDLASAEGLEGLTIGRLASELEMSKSGLFGHFGSKEELQLATVDAAATRFVAEVVEPALDAPEGRERLRALCAAYIDHLRREVYPGGCFWASVTSEFDDRPGRVRDAIRERMAAWLGALERQAEIAGVPEPKRLAFELFALVQGASSMSRLFGDRDAFDWAADSVERMLP
jgi:AcrR family transcriptional regulator